jgi:hypothetical protein
MEARDALLERFGRAIDLPAYLTLHGFEPVAGSPPDAAGLLMTNSATGKTLHLRKDGDRGSWTYSDPRGRSEQGTVVDYLQRHEGLARDACLERLIACADFRRADVPEAVRYRALALDKPEALRRAEGEYALAVDRERDATKLLERVGIKRATLDEWRFGGLKTETEVARALGEPEKLWASRYRPADKKLVFTERAIDAIGLEQSRGDQSACYVAVGGRLDDAQKRRIAHVLAELPPGMSVVLAFGRDRAGHQLAEEVRALAPAVKMERLTPEFGSRWSDQVQLEQRHARSISRVAHQLVR